MNNIVNTLQMRAMLRFWEERKHAAIGFVGATPGKMTRGQAKAFADIITAARQVAPLVELHHGDTPGSCEEAHAIAMDMGAVRVVVHPAAHTAYRARLAGHDNRPAWPSFRRDLDILTETNLLIACPGFTDTVNNWMVVREADRIRRAVMTILPERVGVRR